MEEACEAMDMDPFDILGDVHREIQKVRDEVEWIKQQARARPDLAGMSDIIQAVTLELEERTGCMVRKGSLVNSPKPALVALGKHRMTKMVWVGLCETGAWMVGKTKSSGTWVDYAHPDSIDRLVRHLGEKWGVAMGRYRRSLVGMARRVIDGGQ